MTEGPREDRPDLTEGADKGPIDPEPRSAEPEPRPDVEPEPEPEPESAAGPEPEPEPAPPPEPSPEPAPAPAPADERPASLFVVAARQPEPESTPDDDVLYIVPAAQPGPAPVVVPRPAPAPAPQPEFEPEPAPRRRRRPGCFAFLLLLVIAIVAGAAYAYRSGVLTPRLVLNAAGFAAAEVEFVNLLDDRVTVNLALPNTAGESFPAAIRLEPYDIATHRAPRPSDLRVTVLGLDGESLATCLLRLKAGDRYRIVVLPERSLIQRVDEAPPGPSDLLLDTLELLPMKRPFVVVAAALLVLASCSPSVTVNNGAGFPVRAIVTGEEGARNVHLVSPTQTVNGDVPDGAYAVTVVPDADWVAYAQTLRERLEQRLVNAPSLTSADVNEIVARLAEIAARLRAFEREAGSASCQGTVAADAIATAEIFIETDGSLTVICSGARPGA